MSGMLGHGKACRPSKIGNDGAGPFFVLNIFGNMREGGDVVAVPVL